MMILQVWRGDEEGDIFDDELLASPEWRDGHALLGQQGKGRRHGLVLRPVWHGQDDALGGPRALPHRRRRAW